MSTLITTTAQIGTIKDAGGNANAMTILYKNILTVFLPLTQLNIQKKTIVMHVNQDTSLQSIFSTIRITKIIWIIFKYLLNVNWNAMCIHAIILVFVMKAFYDPKNHQRPKKLRTHLELF